MMRLARRIPDFGVPSQPSGIAAMYDASDDWVPIYDRSSLHGYFMACGTSGNQFKNAPMAGQYMRDDHRRNDGRRTITTPIRCSSSVRCTGLTIDLGGVLASP